MNVIEFVMAKHCLSMRFLWDMLEVLRSWEGRLVSGTTNIRVCDVFCKMSGLDSFLCGVEDEVKSLGYVVLALEAAFWAFWTSDMFKGGELKVANLIVYGDTVGGVYDELVGWWYGVENTVGEWLEGS